MRVSAHACLMLCLLLSVPLRSLAADVAPIGATLKLSGVYAEADGNPIYDLIPITVEMRAKLQHKTGINTLISNGLKISIRHWELYAARDSGFLTAFLPGCNPSEIKSSADIVDGKWHYVAMTFDGTTVKLFADGAEVASQATKPNKSYADVSPLTFGYYPDVPPPGDVELDEVRISHSLRDVSKVPAGPYKLDAETIGLWHFDEKNPDEGFADLSVAHNPVRIVPFPPPGDGVAPDTKTKWSEMDFGPFFSCTLGGQIPKGNITHKAIAIRLGKDAAVAFDTDLLRVSCGWTGDFIKISPKREGLVEHHNVGGTPVFGTSPGPGWARPGTEDFTDPRKDKLGPLPREWAKYRGMYTCGDQVVLSYTVGDVPVRESHGVVGDHPVFSRQLNVGPTTQPLAVRLCSFPGGKQAPPFEKWSPDLIIEHDGTLAGITVLGLSIDSQSRPILKFVGGSAILVLPANESGYLCNVLVQNGSKGQLQSLDESLRAFGGNRPQSLALLTHGGSARYPEILETKGTLGDSKSEISNSKSKAPAPYVVDTLTAPESNPWKSFLRFSGFDFYSNGDVAVCSISGDVWRVSGVDEKLDHLKWRRIATGLYQPLGLKIVDDTVYVLGRDQITRLHDLNGDGEIDFYECFNNDCKVTTQGHAFAANLERDAAGNFYFTKGADGSEHGGTLLRVSPDGAKMDVVAVGIRFSNGLGIGPHGEITEADNEGNWVPSSRIDLIREPRQFLGHTPTAHMDIPPTDPGRPICWMPKNIDNSSASQVWVTSDKWGPFAGEMLHTSYGQASLLHVMTEEVNGQIQGGVYKFPLSFESGIMRGRFNPKDGQLYVCGLRGWQTRGGHLTALQRVRFTGQPVRMPAALHVHQNGVRLTFTCPIDPKSVDADAFGVLQWNYKWSSAYGSRHWSVLDPEKQGFDTLEVKSARLLADGKTVFLEIPSIQRVMQMQITYNLATPDGAAVKGDVYNTIHELAPAFAP
jgi:hypothetical protein